jgi:hypothetical protein
MKKDLLIYCEGETEERLAARLLRNHLLQHGVCVARPIVAATSLEHCGQRGGFVNWDAIRFDLTTLFANHPQPDFRFTTLLDTYAMPKRVLELAGFSGPVSTVADIEAVEQAIERNLGEPRFKAYLQRHELEALVLADLDAVGRVFPDNQIALEGLHKELAGFSTPEDINHGPTTHPSARLQATIPGYAARKASHAFFVLMEAGLDPIRARCPRFNAWMVHWENWGSGKP